MTSNPAFAVHGGAILRQRIITPKAEAELRVDLARALTTGYDILQQGGSALDAVEAGVVVLEDSPQFNAGKGAHISAGGTCELDAAIMDGRTLQAGAVAQVHRIKNPVSLARLIMTHSRHVFMVGEGAEEFAVSQGVPTVPNDYFVTKDRWQEYERRRDAKPAAEPEPLYGTVGAVALDNAGSLAAATSTGGLFFKPRGRIGDTPIIGAGTYASNQAGCAVSATGLGEVFIRHAVAVDICKRVEYLGESIDEAAAHVIHTVLPPQGAGGGVIVVDRSGHSALVFNTSGMYRGYIDANGKPVVDI